MRLSLAVFVVWGLLALPMLAGPGASPADSSGYQFDNENSTMTVYGTSNVRDWDMDVTEINGSVLLEDGEGKLPSIREIQVEVPVENMVSGKDRLQRHAHEAVAAEEHPTISFAASDVQVGKAEADSFSVVANGDLTIKGNTRSVTLSAKGTWQADGTLRVSGEHRLKLSTFEVERPSLMFGAIKVKDPIQVGFDVALTRPPQPASITSIGATPNPVDEGETVHFSSNVQGDSPITSGWSFGDGSSASGTSPTHRYDGSGKYTVRLRASNEIGEDTDTLTVTVNRRSQPAQIASIRATPNPPTVGDEMTFRSSMEGTTPVTYEWTFGDGSSASGASPTHTYRESGQYTVRLRTSNDAEKDSQTLTVEVNRERSEICTTVSEFNSAFFEPNSSTLTSDARSDLHENADIISQCPNLSVRIEGLAAPNEQNPESLSEDRSEAIATFYRENGVPVGRISTSGEGPAEGVGTNKGDAQRYRRVDSIPQHEGGGM